MRTLSFVKARAAGTTRRTTDPGERSCFYRVLEPATGRLTLGSGRKGYPCSPKLARRNLEIGCGRRADSSRGFWEASPLTGLSRFVGLAKAREIDQRVAAEEAAEEEAHHTSRGISEADLTDEQREAAARQIHQETRSGARARTKPSGVLATARVRCRSIGLDVSNPRNRHYGD